MRRFTGALLGSTVMVAASFSSAGAPPGKSNGSLDVGPQEIVLNKAERDRLGLKWFCDGNLGVLGTNGEWLTYAANGSSPVRVRWTHDLRVKAVENVRIATSDSTFNYLAGGPVYRDPATGKLLLFYHAERHRGTARNFYSVLGLAIQTDPAGLEFKDLGLIYRAHLPPEKAERSVEVGGGAYMIRDGFLYVYARDTREDGGAPISLSVARARLSDVMAAALQGRAAEWKKYFEGAFSEPAIGGRSSALEAGNPQTRWFDVAYNTVARKCLLVVAANTSSNAVGLFAAWSEDGIRWSARTPLAVEQSELFYPSIVDVGANAPRQCGGEFWVYYTRSEAGGWNRWGDAAIARRRIRVYPAGEVIGGPPGGSKGG